MTVNSSKDLVYVEHTECNFEFLFDYTNLRNGKWGNMDNWIILIEYWIIYLNLRPTITHMCAGPILESKGMRAIFQKKSKKRAKKDKYLKLWTKMYKT